MSSQCLNSSWSPQPTDLVCVLPDPDTPDPDNVTPDPNSNHGSTSAKKGRELVIVGASSAVSLLFLFIVGVAVVFCCCRRKIGKTLCDYEYTEMLATSPPPSGTAGGRTTTPFTYHEQIQDPVSPSDSPGRYTITQSTTRATNDCPPAPGLQASPLSVHTSERGTRLSLQTRVSRGNPSTSTSIQRIISRTSLLSFYTPSRESQLPRVYCLRSYRCFLLWFPTCPSRRSCSP
ncbi:hypothetical protein GBAR_LOCUS13698 [Geodia barretti]|uniref:Uncharacterized protein n=1 Tax=Geodia barretti TaxID=519541 RepID=A0AA35S4R5_GEOBA|nr:hypothetical protein GBAR_LOCUS13698 [Geodia barretti]